MADALSSGGSDLWSCGFKSRQPHHVFLMDETLIEAVKQWNIDASLPLQVGDFTLIFSFEPAGKGEETIFAYKDEKKGWTVRALYNDGSGDFSVRVDIGMLEFSLIEFITDDFDAFRSMTEERLPAIIESHYVHAEKDFNVIMKQKAFPTAIGRVCCRRRMPASGGPSTRPVPCVSSTVPTWSPPIMTA